jgi:hypothetical protein
MAKYGGKHRDDQFLGQLNDLIDTASSIQHIAIELGLECSTVRYYVTRTRGYEFPIVDTGMNYWPTYEELEKVFDGQRYEDIR